MQTALFIVPVFCCDELSLAIDFLQQTIASIEQQSDTDWHIVLVDDASPNAAFRDFLCQLATRNAARMTLLCNLTNSGPGVARNRGIDLAAARGYPFVLFNDADDLSHPNRLQQVRRTFAARPEVDIIYSPFRVIDEQGRQVADTDIPPAIKSIRDGAMTDPAIGDHAWLKILTDKKGYVNLTSMTSVRTALAVECPFPAVFVSEDTVTWLKYSAVGKQFAFIDHTPGCYRICLAQGQIATQQRQGNKAAFFRQVIQVNEAGIRECIRLSLSNGTVTVAQAEEAFTAYLQHMAKLMASEQLTALAEQLQVHALEPLALH